MVGQDNQDAEVGEEGMFYQLIDFCCLMFKRILFKMFKLFIHIYIKDPVT